MIRRAVEPAAWTGHRPRNHFRLNVLHAFQSRRSQHFVDIIMTDAPCRGAYCTSVIIPSDLSSSASHNRHPNVRGKASDTGYPRAAVFEGSI